MSRTFPVFIGVMAFAVLFMAFGWVGYIASDDQMYVGGATAWLDHFPYVGDSHWTLRHTLVLPIAAAFYTLGLNEFALILPVPLYYLALLALVFFMTNRYFGLAPASLAVVLLSSLPLMAIQSSIVFPDFTEVFFCLLSLSLFLEATRSERPAALLILAGVAAGFGWMTRETVVFFLLTYGVLFLVGYGVPRRLYFVMAAGFLAVAGLELAYYAVFSDSPFHRIVTDLKSHLKVDVSGGLDAVGEGVSRTMERVEGATVGVQSRTGNFSVNRLLDPIIAVVINQEFMFLYYLALPAALWIGFRHRARPEPQVAFIRVFGLAGLIWFSCLWLQIGMSLLPRYYMLPTVIMTILFAVWLHDVVMKRSKLLLAAIVCFLIGTNVLGIYVDNRDPLFAERALARLLQQNGDTVVTDPETARRGSFIYRLAEVTDRVVEGVPKPGDLFYFNPTYTVIGLKRRNLEGRAADYLPQADWQKVWEEVPERRWVGRLVEALGLKPLLPAEIFRRLDQPNPTVVLYRVPQQPGTPAAGGAPPGSG